MRFSFYLGFPLWLSTESACNVGDPSSIPGLGRSRGEGNGNPCQYSCLENPMDRGAWRATVHGVTNSWTGHDWSDPACMGLLLWHVELGSSYLARGWTQGPCIVNSESQTLVYRWGWSLCGSPRPPAVRRTLKTITKCEHPYLHREGCTVENREVIFI